MSRAAEWLRKLVRRRKKIKFHFTITGEKVDIIKTALLTYAASARKPNKRIAEKTIRLIEFQEKNNK